jgi:hypothetical protein
MSRLGTVIGRKKEIVRGEMDLAMNSNVFLHTSSSLAALRGSGGKHSTAHPSLCPCSGVFDKLTEGESDYEACRAVAIVLWLIIKMGTCSGRETDTERGRE